jgi:hydroxymethylbilane synthase
MSPLRLGTRGSQLALFQAHTVAALLQARSGIACEIVVIKTSGDRLAEVPLAEVGGKRLFVKEIEDALLAGEVDLAVHSSKDMPAVLPEGLALGAVLPREDARDAIVLPQGGLRAQGPGLSGEHVPGLEDQGSGFGLEDLVRHLGQAPRIGTSSVRRTAQLSRLFPGARFAPIRGNLDTRLRKLDAGDFDAIVLAAAGLIRLEHRERISMALPPHACLPAPGQGIIAVEIRAADTVTGSLVRRISDPAASAALTAERVVVERLGGGCQMPIAAYAVLAGATLTLTALVLSLDGDRSVRATASGAVDDAEGIGTRAAEELLSRGAAEILADADLARGPVEGLQP